LLLQFSQNHLNRTSIWEILLLQFLLLCPALLPAQNYRSQEGISIGGGTSSLGRYKGSLSRSPEGGNSELQSIAWELGIIRIRKTGENMAFSYGMSLMMLGHKYRSNLFFWKPGSPDSVVLTNSRQTIENYYLGIPLRWSFYLNQNPAGRFFIGPGLLLAMPIYRNQKISGTESNGQSRDISDRSFPEKGPYAFICPELETGYLVEFPDCSLARFSLFFSLRSTGILKDENYYSIQSYTGLRFAWIFGTD